MSRIEKRKKKRIWPWVVGILGVLVLAVVVYGIIIYKNLTDTAKEIHEPIDRTVSEKREEPVVFKDQEPFSMLYWV